MKILLNFLLLSFIASLISCGDDTDSEPQIINVSFKDAQTITSEGSGTIFIPLKIEGASNKEVFVTYEVSGTADFPLDITPLTSTTFIIPAGATAYNIEMRVQEDNELELEGEQLTIKLISISEGGELGAQTSHQITIEPDDVVIVSFDQAESYVPYGENVNVKINLSKPYNEDIELTFKFNDLEYTWNGYESFYYFDIYEDKNIIVKAGETSAIFQLVFNDFYYNPEFTGFTVNLEILDIADENGQDLTKVFTLPEQNPEHDVYVSEGTGTTNDELKITMSWTSSNEDVDLDIYLVDENGQVFLSSIEEGFDSTESLILEESLEDRTYYLVVSWYQGTGSADIDISIDPTGNATWEGSKATENATYNDITEAGLENTNVFASITKSGNNYE